jgi:hypothetical protein
MCLLATTAAGFLGRACHDTPQRSRSHVLETDSEDVFRALISARWLVRQLSEREYGGDREVEVFENGATTGFTFQVQPKEPTSPVFP